MKTAWVLLALAAGITGCDRRSAECAKIVNILNDSTDKTGRPKVGEDAGFDEQNSELAALAEKMASSLAAASVTTPELKKIVAEYEIIARDTSQATREMKLALGELGTLGKGDIMKRAKTAKEAMTDSTVKLVAYCAKKSDGECKKVKSEIPAEPKSGDDFVKVAKAAEAFGKFEWKDKALAELITPWTKAVAEADKVVGELSKQLEASKNLEAKVTNAHMLLKRATQKSDVLSTELNKVCRP